MKTKEEIAAYQKAYREANKERLRSQNKEYREKRSTEKRAEIAAKQRAYYAANKAKYQAYEHMRRYGLSLEDLNRMRERQHSRCASCGRDTKKLFVDHDHKTGAIRALLCLNCNTMIGHAHEDPARLEAGAQYLRRFQ